MAGKNQHHIWQLIQRGFAVKEHGDDHIWVFAKNTLPGRTVTRKYGSERYFYGEPNSEADLNITAFEQSYVDFIREARSAETTTTLDPSLVAPLISHLEMRSAFLRGEMSRISERMLILLREKLSKPNSMTPLLRNYLRNNPDQLANKLKGSNFSPSMLSAISDFLNEKLPVIVKEREVEVSEFAARVIDPLLAGLAEIAKAGHMEALAGSFSDIKRTHTHEQLDYHVLQFPEGTLILPDSCVAFLLEGKVRPLSQKGDKIEMTLLPISSGSMIVGTKKNNIFRPVAVINAILASCSFETFIAKDNFPAFNFLASKIGKSAKLMQDSEIVRIVNSISI